MHGRHTRHQRRRPLLYAVLGLIVAQAHAFLPPLASISGPVPCEPARSGPRLRMMGEVASPPIIVADDQPTYPLHAFDLPRHYVSSGELSSVMIPVGLIEDRIEKMASDVLDAYASEGVHEARLLCVLKGASRFFHRLVDAMQRKVVDSRMDLRLSFEFVRVKSYEGTSSTGNVQVEGMKPSQLQGRHVLLVEDIVDTGNTLRKLLPYLESFGPASLRVAALLEKRVPARAQGPILTLDFVGFNIPDKFIVGYNMDYNEQYRDLSHLCVISDKGVDMHRDAE